MLHWLPDASSGGAPLKQHHRAQRTQTYRYPLYTEGRRETLAAQLQASTKGRSAAKLIQSIDDYGVQHDSKHLPDEYHDGPFGVFDARRVSWSTVDVERSIVENGAVALPATVSVAVAPTASNDFEASDRSVDLDALISSLQDRPTSESIEEIEEIRNVHQGDESLEAAIMQSSTTHNFWQLCNPFSWMDDINTPLEISGGDLMGFETTPLAFTTGSFTGLLDNTSVALRSPTPPLTNSDLSHLLAEAPLLLRYYQSGGNASRPAKQSFWRSFVLPSAMRTFAELTVFGQASDLSSSVFYSTIANSAFAMQRSDSLQPDDSHWSIIGTAAEDAARGCLQNALQSPQPDCRELLTATLSLALVSVSRSAEGIRELPQMHD